MTLKDLLKFLYLTSFPLRSIRLIPAISIPLLLFTITIYFYLLRDLPSPRSLSSQPLPLTTHIRDRNGQVLYKIYKNQNRTLVKLTDLPVALRQAVISIEDSQFYSHNGYSPTSILRALIKNLNCATGKPALPAGGLANCKTSLQGGSTITQQLVKTSLLTPEKTLKRKARELVLAIAVEALYSKDQILEMYLNRVSFGGSSYGIEEAAQTYFGKSASDLSLPESTLLAGLPASPTTYSPFGAHPELAKSRQKEVLRRMVENGYLSWDQAEAASAQDLNFAPQKTDIKAPHFVMYVKEILSQKYGPQIVEQGGLDVITSLDLSIQEQLEKIVREETARIAYLHIGNGAALVTRPKTGEILAMVGSRDYFDFDADGQFNVTTSPRQPGSAIKPITYSLAFGRGFTPASTIDDSPITYSIPGLPPYQPVNYDHRYHGRVTLRTALASSYNVPAVKLLSSLGVPNLIDFGTRLGISTWPDPSRFGLSLTLGGGEVTMLDLATSYGVFANEGRRIPIYPILSVTDSRGTRREVSGPVPESVLDPGIAFLISDILSDNAARTPTFGSRSQLYIPGQVVAVKTGTTNNLRDNWTIGYTPELLTAVWVGNNDNTPMSYVASGITGASPIWRRAMDLLLKIYPSSGFSPPTSIARLATCAGKSDYFLAGTLPPPCPSPTPTGTPKPEVQPTPDILTGASTEIYNKPKLKNPRRR